MQIKRLGLLANITELENIYFSHLSLNESCRDTEEHWGKCIPVVCLAASLT